MHILNVYERALKGAQHADLYKLWRGSKATVEFTEHIGVHAKTGQLTRRMNVYRTLKGRIHATPASPR